MGSRFYSKRHQYRYHRGRNRSLRAKTFSSEQAARAYAEQSRTTNYELVNLKSPESKSKKFRIVAA